MKIEASAAPGVGTGVAAEEKIRYKELNYNANAADLKIPMGLVASCRSGVKEAWLPNWEELTGRLNKAAVGEKDGLGYVPGHVKVGPRNGSNVTPVPVLILDVEAKTQKNKATGDKIVIGREPPPFAEMMLGIELNYGLTCCGYTTHSHAIERPRYRLVFLLSRPATTDEIKAIGPLLAAKLEIAGCYDPASFSAGQLFYFPRVPEERLHLFEAASSDGVPVDVDTLLGDAKRSRKERRDMTARGQALGWGGETPIDSELLADLEDALRHISADDRKTWIDVGLALKSLGDAGRGLWLAWSATSTAFNEATDPQQWDTFEPTRGIRYDYVFKLARDKGWVNPKSRHCDAEIASGEVIRLDYIDFSDLETNPPPPRRWVVPDLIPKGHVTGLFGPGAVGKSLLALQLAIACANSHAWLGLDVEAGPVIGLFAEDDRDEMRRRAYEIFLSEMLEPATASARLHLDGRAGKQNVLMTFGQDRVGDFTALFDAINADCERVQPVLVILDNIAQTFAGLQNDAGMVTQFCNGLTKIAQEFDSAVLLLGHPAKAEGSEFSGTVAWENAVRSRLFMGRNEDGTVTLRTGKANYAALTETRLEYSSGAFRPLIGGDTGATGEAAKQTVLSALKTLTSRQVAVSHNPRSGNYLVRLIRQDADMHCGNSLMALRKALEGLIDQGELQTNVELPWRTSSRHKATGLALAEPL